MAAGGAGPQRGGGALAWPVELYGRLSTLGEHVGKLGTSLGGAVTAYNQAVGSLEARVLVSARKLAELGVSDDELPTPAQVELAPRQPQAPELLAPTPPHRCATNADWGSITSSSQNRVHHSDTGRCGQDRDGEGALCRIGRTSPEDENVRSSPIRRRVSAALLASAVTAAGVTLVSGSPAHAAPPPTPEKVTDVPNEPLDPRDRQLLAEAEANGEPTVTVVVATDRDETGAVAQALTRLGATVDNRVDDVGYVRARVPTALVRKAATLPGVAALDLDEKFPLPEPTPETRPGPLPRIRPAGPGPTTPAANPYLPTHETGAVSFVKAHPTWDGRGVTIGIMDTGVDLDHPALQQTTSTGERKIVDWFTATDPLEDPSWRAMITEVTGPTFTYAGETWTAPAGT